MKHSDSSRLAPWRVLFILFTTALSEPAVAAQFSGWAHVGSIYVLTTTNRN